MANWQIHLLYAAVIAIAFGVLMFVAYIKKGQYEQEAAGCIKAVIKRRTGWPLVKIVRPYPDGWVRVERGDYKLAEEFGGKAADKSKLTDEKRMEAFGERRINTNVMEWDRYPSHPFLGLKRIQTPIRRQEWFENNPEPITWPEHRTTITAADAQAHSREMDAMNVAIRIQESDEKEKRFMQIIQGIPTKTIVYIGLGAAVLVGVINLIRSMS